MGPYVRLLLDCIHRKMKLGDEFPNFSADTDQGKINFHEWLGNSWGLLCSHPADYTPVCTTELGKLNAIHEEFEKRGVKVIALSIDDAESHKGWSKDLLAFSSTSIMKFPIIADKNRELANAFGMIDPDEINSQGIALTARAVFVIGPDKKLKLSILYPATTGRNFDEILRVIDSLQLTAVKKVATPVSWQPGDKCMVIPSLSNDQANTLFKDGFRAVELPSGKPYMRFTAH